MAKKPVFLLSLVVILTGLTFVAAKLNPCLAKERSCNQPTFSAGQIVPIVNYSPELVQKSLQEKKRVVLFFQASWCSTCYLIEKDFQAEASKIPADVVIFRVNIDTEKELKSKYAVVAQDELVQIDTAQKEISHWKSSEHAVDELLAHLQ